MKVKLLKEVRKRFSITYYPKGVTISQTTYIEPLILVYDNWDRVEIKIIFLKSYDFVTKQSSNISIEFAKSQAHKELVWAIRGKYMKYGTRRIKADKIRKAKEEALWKQQKAEQKLEQEQVKENIWYNKK